MKRARGLTPSQKPTSASPRLPAAQPPPRPRRGPPTAGPDPGCEEGRRSAPPSPSSTRGLPAGAAAAAGQGWRRPGRAARPSGRVSPQPAAPAPRPELPARPLTCSPPPSGPSARRAAAAARPGPLSPPPLEAAGGPIRCDSARPPRLPPPAQASASRGRAARGLLGPRAPTSGRPPRARAPWRPARPAESEGAALGGPLAGETEARVPGPGARRSPVVGPCVPPGLRASPRPHTAFQPRKKRRNSSERRPAGFLPVVRASSSPARGSFPHSRQSWRPLWSVPFFPEESLSGQL